MPIVKKNKRYTPIADFLEENSQKLTSNFHALPIYQMQSGAKGYRKLARAQMQSCGQELLTRALLNTDKLRTAIARESVLTSYQMLPPGESINQKIKSKVKEGNYVFQV